MPAPSPRVRFLGQGALAAAIVLLSWPVVSLRRPGLDFSWAMALHEAAAEGLGFGRDIVFTYGPIGFLSVPAPFVGPTSAVAFVATGLVYLALVAVTLQVARRHFALPVAAVLTLLLARAFVFLPPYEALQVLGFVVAVELLSERLVVPWRAVAIGAGLIAAVALLGKLNVGVFVVAMGACVVVALAPRRLAGVGLYASSAAIGVLVLWIVSGQRLDDLVPYARGSFEIVAGYSQAMGTDRDPGAHWIYAAFALVVGLFVWLAWQHAASWTANRRLALIGLLAIVAFAMWKTSFVRGYPHFAFAGALFVGLALVPRTVPRSTAALVLLVLGVVFLGTSRVQPVEVLDVAGSARDGLLQARDALLPFRWETAATAARERLRGIYGLPPGVLAELAGRTVHVEPFEAAIATAYPEFTWRPPPVFQGYSAFTPALDELNAAFLRSPDRPERILREYRPGTTVDAPDAPLTVDGRFYWFDAPAATLERLCRYAEVSADARWQVLADTGRACLTAMPLGRVEARTGEAVAVPAAPASDQFVVVRIEGLDDGLLGRLRTSLWKSPEWYISLDGVEFRLVPGTAADGLVLAVPDPAQGSGPFRFGDPIGTIALRERGSASVRPLTFDFLAVPLSVP